MSTEEEKGTVSQLIWQLKSSFHPGDFERVIETLTARDEAAVRGDASCWKSKYDAMEKKHGIAALDTVIALEEQDRLRREIDLLKDQIARGESEQRSSIERLAEGHNSRIATFKERERKREEKYAKVKAEKVELECRVSRLESEKEKAEREVEACKSLCEERNRRIVRLEEEMAALIRAGAGAAEVAADTTGGNLTEFLVNKKGSEVNCGEKADSLTRGGSDAVASVEIGRISRQDNGSTVVIEIVDSDDEMPSRKRGLSKNDNEDVKPTKKRLIDLLEELPNRANSLDFSDKGDSSSSCSDSDIDSKMEIQRLSKKVSGVNPGH